MLNKLPLEIVIYITTLLSFKDRLTLSLTNKKLRLLIWNNTLFRELFLKCLNNEKERAFVEDFKKKKINGHQVKELKLRSVELPDDVFCSLALAFPNVTYLEDMNFGLTRLTEPKKSSDVLNTILPWKDTLQRFHSDRQFTQLYTLFEKNVFSKLQYLTISPYEEYNLVGKPMVNLFQCLTNAPSLLHLRLFNMTVHIRFLEELHTRVPQLQSLTLESLIINTKNDMKLSSMEPNTRLLSLEIKDSVLICDRRCFFLTYIMAKYRSLETLIFSSALDVDREELDGDIPHCSEENNPDFDFDLGDVNENGSNTIMLNALRDDHEATQEAYNMKGYKRFRRLPPSLKVLKVNTAVFEDLPEVLEMADIQPKILGFGFNSMPDKIIFESLPEIEFFQKWTFLTTLDIIIANDFNPDNKCLISASITTLKLTLLEEKAHQNYFIDCILFSFPSVNTLSIHHTFSHTVSFIRLNTDRNPIATDTLYPNLRSLYVDCTLMDPRVSVFLSQCVPNLQQLQVNVIANRLSLLVQKAYRPPAHDIILDNVRTDRLNISFSYESDFEDILMNIGQKMKTPDFNTDKNLGYLVVQNQNQGDKYTFRKEMDKEYVDFTLVNDIKVDDMNDRIQISLRHTGTMKSICVGGYTVH